MAQPGLKYVIYNLFPDQEPQFIEAFQETLRRRGGDGSRCELSRAQGKAANYILRIESGGQASAPSLWLSEPLSRFMSSIVSATVYERVERAPVEAVTAISH